MHDNIFTLIYFFFKKKNEALKWMAAKMKNIIWRAASSGRAVLRGSWFWNKHDAQITEAPSFGQWDSHSRSTISYSNVIRYNFSLQSAVSEILLSLIPYQLPETRNIIFSGKKKRPIFFFLKGKLCCLKPSVCWDTSCLRGQMCCIRGCGVANATDGDRGRGKRAFWELKEVKNHFWRDKQI